MRININEKGSEAFYREVVNAAVQYRALMKQPDRKLKDYYVRQLWDGKGSIDLSLLSPERMTLLAQACGWTLAHAHARTGDRFAIAGYLGNGTSFDEAMVRFAQAYADQNEADYARFMEALEAGELS